MNNWIEIWVKSECEEGESDCELNTDWIEIWGKVKVILNLTPKELIYRGKSESDCELNTDSIEMWEESESYVNFTKIEMRK